MDAENSLHKKNILPPESQPKVNSKQASSLFAGEFASSEEDVTTPNVL